MRLRRLTKPCFYLGALSTQIAAVIYAKWSLNHKLIELLFVFGRNIRMKVNYQSMPAVEFSEFY